MLSKWDTAVILTLVTWPEVSVCQISPLWSYPFPPFPYGGLWKKVTDGVRGHAPPPKRWSIYINFWSSSVGQIVYFPHLFSLFNHLLMSMRTHCIYFILWVIIQFYLIYFVAQVVPALGIRSPFSLLLGSFDMPPSLWVLTYWNTFSLSDTIRCLGLMLYVFWASARISHFSPRSPSSFYWGKVL